MERPARGRTAIGTPRLRLRGHQASDLEPLVAMVADPEAMRFLGGPWPRERSLALVGLIGSGRDGIGRTFARPGVGRAISASDPPNARSRAAMARLGLRLERAAWAEEDGERPEAALHAVTRPEWDQRRRSSQG